MLAYQATVMLSGTPRRIWLHRESQILRGVPLRMTRTCRERCSTIVRAYLDADLFNLERHADMTVLTVQAHRARQLWVEKVAQVWRSSFLQVEVRMARQPSARD